MKVLLDLDKAGNTLNILTANIPVYIVCIFQKKSITHGGVLSFGSILLSLG